MKKLIPLILALALLTGCAGTGATDGGASGATMPEIIDQLCEGVDVPAHEATELTEADFEYFAFIPKADGLTGYQADALINSIPHSLVLVRSENGDTAEIAQEMLEHADARKWICVSADVKQAAYTEHYAVLVMSSTETAEGILANFEAAVNDGGATILSAVASDNAEADLG